MKITVICEDTFGEIGRFSYNVMRKSKVSSAQWPDDGGWGKCREPIKAKESVTVDTEGNGVTVDLRGLNVGLRAREPVTVDIEDDGYITLYPEVRK